VDGVILKLGFQSATFLPQVWEKIPDKVAFLDQLALKAGAARGAWRESGTKVDVYQVEAFEEAKTH
jgi:AMMECR1 domain-containing protein